MFIKKSIIFRIICWFLAILLIQNNLEQVQAQPTPFFPSSNYIDLSIPYSLPVLRGMRVYPNNPFDFAFVVDSGDKRHLDQKETSLLVKYFLTFLTIPEEDLWVNLSPYEAGKIIPADMAQTVAGNTLLEQDKLLKQLSSSLTYPETSLGKKFWDKVYKIANERYGTTNLPINTYNKVWIVPDKAVVYDMGDSAMIGDTHFKVMLEEDYLARSHSRHSERSEESKGVLRSFANAQDDNTHTIASQITKEIILPQLEKEINTGKNFAPVRQMFHSLVLADWFKRELRRNILSEAYVNKKKMSGVDGVNKNATENIYKQYLRIFKVGAYNYIREDVDPITNQVVPRKYFSGGLFWGNSNRFIKSFRVIRPEALTPVFEHYAGSNFAMVAVKLDPIGHLSKSAVQVADLAQATALAVEGSEGVMDQRKVAQFYLPGGRSENAQYKTRKKYDLTPAAFNRLLDRILEEGTASLTGDVELTLADSVAAFAQSGDGIVQRHIDYYENLLTPPVERVPIAALANKAIALEKHAHELYDGVSVNDFMAADPRNAPAILKEYLDASNGIFEAGILNSIHLKKRVERPRKMQGKSYDRIWAKLNKPYAVADLLYIMRTVYMAEKPLEAINAGAALPIRIEETSRDLYGTAVEVARRMVAVRDEIKEAANRLTWEQGDALLARGPVKVQVVSAINTQDPNILIQYDVKERKIYIGKDALKLQRLSEKKFIEQVLEAFQLDEVKGMAKKLRGILAGTDDDGQRILEEKILALIKQGRSLSSFVKVVNLNSGNLTYEDAIKLLRNIQVQGELTLSQVEEYIGQSSEEEKNVDAREYAPKPSSRVVEMFKRVGAYLRRHQFAVGITAAFFAFAGVAHGATGDVHADGHHIPGRVGAEDLKYVQIADQLATLDDVGALNGHQNTESHGGIYDVDMNWMKRIWNAPISSDYVGWGKGNKIVALQHKWGLHENGQLNEETKTALAENAAKAGISVTDLSKPVAKPVEHRSPVRKAPAPRPAAPRPAAQQYVPPTERQAAAVKPDDKIGGGVVNNGGTLQGVSGKIEVSVEASAPASNTVEKVNAPIPAVVPPEPVRLPITVTAPPLVPKAPLVSRSAPEPVKSAPIYAYPSKGTYKLMAPIEVKNVMVTQTEGIVTGLNTQKKDYDRNKGPVLTVLDESNRNHMAELEGNIRDQEDIVRQKSDAQKQGVASALEVLEAKVKLFDLQEQLAKAKDREELGIKKAPYNVTFKDFKVAEGDQVGPGKPIGEYYDRDHVRFDIEIPYNLYFGKVEVTLDGQPVKNTFWFNWDNSPSSPNNIWVSFIMTPDHPIPHGQKVKFHANFYPPDKSPQLPFAVKGRGLTHPIVPEIKEYAKPAAADATFEFVKNQGDSVKKNDLMVHGKPEPFITRLKSVLTQLEAEKIKLTRASFPNGNVVVNGDEVARINANIRRLQTEEMNLRNTLSHLDIRADQDGIIVWSARNGADAFMKNNDLIRTNNNTVFLGDLNNTPYSILFPAGVKEGDIVQGQAPAGLVWGVVTAVSQSPFLSSTLPGSLYSVEVTMNDPRHFLRPNMRFPLTLLTLTDKEKEIALSMGILGEISSAPSAPGAVPPPPPQSFLQGFAAQLFAPNTLQFSTPTAPQEYYAPKGNIVPWSQVEKKVIAYQQVSLFAQYYDVVLRKIDELLPRAKTLSIFGGFFGSGGKAGISGFGGISGMANNMTGALTSGGLANVGFSIFGQFLGDVVKVIDGQIGKEESVDYAWTKSSQYSFATALAQQVKTAKVLYSRLAVVQQEIAHLNELQKALLEAQREAHVAEGYKLIDHSKVLEIEKELSPIKRQIEDKKAVEQTLTSDLNMMMGEKIVDGHQVTAELNLSNFPEFKPTAEQTMRARLLADGTVEKSKLAGMDMRGQKFFELGNKNGIWEQDPRDSGKVRFKSGHDLEVALKKAGYKDLADAIKQTRNANSHLAPILQQAQSNTPDPELLQARAELDVIMAQIRLQGLQKMPSINIGALIPNTDISSWPVEPYGSGAIQRASGITGTDGLVNAKYNIIDQKVKLEGKILAAKKAEAEKKIQNIERRLENELHQTFIRFNSSVEDIKTAHEGYQNALDTWAIPASQPGVYVPYQYAIQRRDLAKSSIETLDPKRVYWEQRENLEKMGLWDDSLLKDKAQLTILKTFRHLVLGLVAALSLVNLPLAAQDRRIVRPAPESVRQNAIRQGSPLGMLGDSNPENRQQVVDMLRDMPNDEKSAEQLVDYVLGSPAADALEETFRTAVERQDVHFFIRVIIKGQGKASNRAVVNLAFQRLADIFKDSPNVLNGLYPTTIVGSLTEAEKVLLTFIAQHPEGLSQAPFLFSNYWNTDQLASICNKLEVYLSKHPNDTTIKGLRDLIENLGIRRIFFEANKGHFTEGEIQNTNSFEPDIDTLNVARGQAKELPKVYEQFFNDPNWQDMEGLRPDLVKGAKAAFDALRKRPDLQPVATKDYDPLRDSPLLEIPDQAVPQDSLRLFGSLDADGQDKYINGGATINGVTFKLPATISELARIVEARTLIKSPLLLDQALNHLMASSDGRIEVLRIYAGSSEDTFRTKIDGLFLYQIKAVKQDAQTIKNPAHMRIFRVALGIMDGRTNQDWIRTTINNTFSWIKFRKIAQDVTKGGGVTTNAQMKKIATKGAIDILLKVYPPIRERDIFIAGQPVYTDDEIALLHLIDQQIDPLNDTNDNDVDDYLSKQAATSPEASKMIKLIITYRDDILARMNNNDQEISTGPSWLRTFKWLYHADFIVPIVLSVGAISYGLIPKLWDWGRRKFSSTQSLIVKLEKETLNLKSRGEETKGINRTKVHPDVADLLESFDAKLNGWSADPSYSTEKMLNDQELMINFTDQIIGKTKYTADLIWKDTAADVNNQLYYDSFAYVALKAAEMSQILTARLSPDNLSEAQRDRYAQNNENMLLRLIYVEKYLDVLQGRANVNTALNEKFYRRDVKEWINYLTTKSLGYTYLANTPVRKLGEDLKDLMNTGNLIMPGTYEDIDGIIKESKRRMDDVLIKARRLQSFGNARSRDNTRKRSWISRLAFLIPSSWYFLLSLLGFARVVPLNWHSFLYSIGGLLFTFSNYWSPALANLKEAENLTMKEIMKRIHNDMVVSSGQGAKVGDWDALKKKIKTRARRTNREQEILELVKKEGEEARVRELKVKNIDVMYFVVREAKDIPAQEEHVKKMVRDQLIRRDVHWEVLPWGQLDGDTFLKTLLTAKKWSYANKMVVFLGKEVKPFDPRIELTVKNLYKAAVNLPKGGLVFGKTRDIVLSSPLQYDPQADQTFGTVWENKNTLHDRPRSWLVTDIHKGLRKVRKLFFNLDLDSRMIKDKQALGGSSIIDILEERGINLDLADQPQISAKSGYIAMGPKAVAMYTSIAEKLGGIKLRLDPDLFVPVFMATAEGIESWQRLLEVFRDYISAMQLNGNGYHGTANERSKILTIMQRSLGGVEMNLYASIAEIVKKPEYRGFKTSAHFPVKRDALYVSDPSPDRVRQLLGNPARSSAAMTGSSRRSGGIDLNFKPQYILRSSGRNAVNFQETGFQDMFDEFKGFKFNIVRFKSQLTVNGAFQLMLSAH